MKFDIQYMPLGWIVSEIHIFISIEFSKRSSERALKKCTKSVLAFHLFDIGGATVHHSSSFFNGYQLCFVPFGQFPTFALNKPVKTRYLLVSDLNLSLEMRYSKTFKAGYFLHLMTQLLGIHNFFPKSYLVAQKLSFRRGPHTSLESSNLTFSPLFQQQTKKVDNITFQWSK